MTYDNIKSDKKTGLHLFSEKRIFRKTTGGESNCQSIQTYTNHMLTQCTFSARTDLLWSALEQFSPHCSQNNRTGDKSVINNVH